MKAIFLDIDGVLATALNQADVSQYFKIPGSRVHVYPLDRKAVSNLNTLVEKSNAYVIVSSTWRRYMPLSTLESHMKSYGFKYTLKAVTPFRMSERPRHFEISEFLEENPRYTKFVILDDNHIRVFRNVVYTDENVGLTEADVEKALKFLE